MENHQKAIRSITGTWTQPHLPHCYRNSCSASFSLLCPEATSFLPVSGSSRELSEKEVFILTPCEKCRVGKNWGLLNSTGMGGNTFWYKEVRGYHPPVFHKTAKWDFRLNYKWTVDIILKNSQEQVGKKGCQFLFQWKSNCDSGTKWKCSNTF